MTLALLTARLVLAAVFLVAGIAKLADRNGSRQALIGFGVPALLAYPLGIALPLAEIAAALALIPRVSAWWGAVTALALFLLFVAGIGVNLARGRTPDCHCFGQLHSQPVGWPTLIRNGLLSLIAVFVVWQGWSDPGRSATGWISRLTAAEGMGAAAGALLLALVIAAGWLLLNLLQQNGRLLARVEALEQSVAAGLPGVPAESISGSGLPIGTPAPSFQLPGLHGETMTLDALRAAGKPVMLVFSDPTCGPCNALLPELSRWQREESARLTIAVISRGGAEANRAKSAEHGLTLVLLQRDREVAESYHCHGTPGAIVIQPDGMIGSTLAQGAEQIRALVARDRKRLPLIPAPVRPANGNGTAPRPPAPATRIGTPAPELKLPDLDGEIVDLAGPRGEPTLVLFWNPGCGFCQRMAVDLKTWEANPPHGAPRLLIVSSGTAEANRAVGLHSTTLLDQGFSAGRAFGASGTPSAVLVDAGGRIASGVAVGAQAVLALASGTGAEIRAN